MTLRHELHPEHIYRMLEQTLIPPTTVRELDPDVVSAAVTRLGSTEGTVSESYMVNSEFTTADLKRLPSPREAKYIRDYYFTTCVEGFDKSLGTRWARQWLPAEILGQLMTPSWTNPVMSQALYGVDLVALCDSALWRQVPGRPGALFEQNVSADFVTCLMDSISVAGGAFDPDNSLILILVGSHARMQFTHGVQAARGMMQFAGMVLCALASQALSLKLKPTIVSHFKNNAVNVLVDADGVDRAVVSVFLAHPQEMK